MWLKVSASFSILNVSITTPTNRFKNNIEIIMMSTMKTTTMYQF